jgi:hypothetical protein
MSAFARIETIKRKTNSQDDSPLQVPLQNQDRRIIKPRRYRQDDEVQTAQNQN